MSEGGTCPQNKPTVNPRYVSYSKVAWYVSCGGDSTVVYRSSYVFGAATRSDATYQIETSWGM